LGAEKEFATSKTRGEGLKFSSERGVGRGKNSREFKGNFKKPAKRRQCPILGRQGGKIKSIPRTPQGKAMD